ncbi:hypothetical protein ATW55_14725 [Ferroacidibacillus organovorans]|uniref:Zinc-ribbon domain-containing protein n=2 Tax=Ferroacidibacillus organovorans TaxID=1765683 RepID=A0A124IW38_9BACL|nr:hypothetical protein ATW55_14725 [Ferroacidibacillus organovorans]
MKRMDWVIATALVIIGLSCLVTAAIGYSSYSMVGMMYWMPMSMFFPAFLLIAMVLVGLFFVYKMMRSNSQRCPKCNATVRSDWNACPRCGTFLKEQ